MIKRTLVSVFFLALMLCQKSNNFLSPQVPPPSVKFSLSETLTADLKKNDSIPVKVSFHKEKIVTAFISLLQSGNGVENRDFVIQNKTVTFKPEDTTGYVYVSFPVEDIKKDLSFSVKIDSVRNGRIGSVFTHTYTVSAKKHTVDCEISGNGEVMISPKKDSYEYGDTVTLTALAESTWVFESWISDIVSHDNPFRIEIAEDKLVTAKFKRVMYELDITVNGTGNVNLSQKQFPKDTVIELTAQRSASGWRFVGWSGDVSGNDSTISVTMSVDRNITATFEKIPVPDNVYCVNSSAEGSGTGTNWADAFTTIDEALEAEENSATVNTVWVAEGEYSPSGDSFFPKNGCTLLGGFEGNEATHSQAEKREWYNNQCFINGEFKNYTLNLSGKRNIIVEGFVFTNSQRNVIYINNPNITIRKCVFKDNGNSTSNSRCIYIANAAGNFGDSIKIIDCVFFNNLGTNGSCILTLGKHTIIGNCVFFNNEGPVIANGINDSTYFTKILNCTMVGNYSNSDDPGAIINTGVMALFNSIIYFNTSTATSGTQINRTGAVRYCNIQNSISGNGIGTKGNGFGPENISEDPQFYSITIPAGDSISFWYHPTDNDHALIPLPTSTSKSSYSLSPTIEPTKYVTSDIRSKRLRGTSYFMGAYERY